MTISTSPRRRQVVISSAVERHALLARGAQRLGDLRLRDPEQPQHLPGGTRRARDGGAEAPRSPRAVAHIGCSSRGGPGSTTHGRAAVAVGRRDDEPRRGADRLEHRRALAGPPPACGWPRARRPGRGRASVPAAGAGSPRCAPPAPRRAPSRGRWKRPTTSAVRSSAVGPSPPLVTIRSHALAGQEAQRGQHVLGPVADDHGVGEVDAELAQPLGQPRPVAVGRRARSAPRSR